MFSFALTSCIYSIHSTVLNVNTALRCYDLKKLSHLIAVCSAVVRQSSVAQLSRNFTVGKISHSPPPTSEDAVPSSANMSRSAACTRMAAICHGKAIRRRYRTELD
jgi:hypothetical protein